MPEVSPPGRTPTRLPDLHDLRHLHRVDRAVEPVLAGDSEAVALVAVAHGRCGEAARTAYHGGVVDELVAEAPAQRGAARNRDKRGVEGKVLDQDARAAVRPAEGAGRPVDRLRLATTAPLGEREAHAGRGVAPVEVRAERPLARGRRRASTRDRPVG